MNETLISLIPKQTSPERMGHLRTISLCNVVVKCITKVIANRLKRCIGKRIGEEQSSFVLGRQGVDDVVLVQEIVHTMRLKKGNKRLMEVKLDLERACDRIDWGFLWTMLQAIGMDEKLIKLILFCASSASLAVLWNGEKLNAFHPQCGLRHEDPLSPCLLFARRF